MITRLRRFIPPLSHDQWLIYFAQMTWGVSYSLWLNLQPLYIEHLGADPQQVGATLSAAGLMVVFVYVPMGLLADRGRRKLIIVSSWMLGTIATFLVGLAPDWRWVIPALGVYLLSSFSRPAVAGHVAATDLSDNPSRTFAFMWTGFSLGSLIGPATGGWIAEAWGLRAVFMVSGLVGALSTAIMLRISDGAALPRSAGPRPASAAVWRDGPFLRQMAVMALIVLALELGTVLAPNYLQAVKGLSLQQIGQLGTLASLGLLALTLTLGYMRTHSRRPMLLNQLLVAAGLVLLLAAPAGAPWHPFLLAGFFLRGGSRAVVPLTRGRVSAWLPPEAASAGFGLVDMAAQTATLLAPLLAGYLYTRDPAWPLVGGVALLGATLIITWLAPATRPAPKAPPPDSGPELAR